MLPRLPPPLAFAVGQTTRVSVASDGTQGNSYGSFKSDISADGRFVTFFSGSNNLVPGDTNGRSDAFLRDRLTKQTTRVSIASDGTQGDSYSFPAGISADGRFVAFTSNASNFIPGDSNGDVDAFVHDRITGNTTPVSIATNGTQGNSLSFAGGISADGRFVGFQTPSNNLVNGDTNGVGDVFVRDRVAKTTTRVSIATNGVQGNAYSYAGGISADGRFVMFSSNANNLVPGDTNGLKDVFVRDRVAMTTTRVSVNSNGTQGNTASYGDDVSADGRFVMFSSNANNLVPGDTNAASDVFVRDRLLLPGLSADIAVTQTESADPVTRGNPLTYRVNVKNNGADPAANVSLIDLVPLNALLLSINPSQGNCYKAPISVCRLGSLAAGANATVNVRLTANKLGVLKNTAFGNAPPKDSAPVNNTSVMTTRVQ